MKLSSFADRDMFCRFAGIGVGHEIQYPYKPASDNNADEDTVEDRAEDEGEQNNRGIEDGASNLADLEEPSDEDEVDIPSEDDGDDSDPDGVENSDDDDGGEEDEDESDLRF